MYVLILHAKSTNGPNWEALSAIGTTAAAMAAFLAVVVALLYPVYQERRNQPILELALYEHSDGTHLKHVRGIYSLPLVITNVGRNTAKNVQAFVKSSGTRKNENWERPMKWVPVPLYWLEGQFVFGPVVFGPGIESVTGAQDLVRDRPAYFHLGYMGIFREEDPDPPNVFNIRYVTMYQDQGYSYKNGLEHCFEVVVYTEGIKPITKYVYVLVEGDYTSDAEEMKKRVTISMKDNAPWPQ